MGGEAKRTRASSTSRRVFRSLLAVCLVASMMALTVTPAHALQRVDAINLEEEDVNRLTSAVIDPAGSFAYFGTDTNPAKVVKVDLGTFAVADVLELEGGLERELFAAVIDPAGDYAYFATDTTPGRVVKIDLQDFAHVETLALESNFDRDLDRLDWLRSAVIDPDGDYAYFGTDSGTPEVAKVDLTNFEYVDLLTLDIDESGLRSAVMDPAGEFAYFATDSTTGVVVKVDLDGFTHADTIVFDDEGDFRSAVIDPAGEFAYFGSDTAPANVVRVNLDDFEHDGTLQLQGVADFRAAVMDPAGGFAYFGTDTTPGRVVKIDLEAFEHDATIGLAEGETRIMSAVIHPAGHFAYFGTDTDPGHVVRVQVSDPPLDDGFAHDVRVKTFRTKTRVQAGTTQSITIEMQNAGTHPAEDIGHSVASDHDGDTFDGCHGTSPPLAPRKTFKVVCSVTYGTVLGEDPEFATLTLQLTHDESHPDDVDPTNDSATVTVRIAAAGDGDGGGGGGGGKGPSGPTIELREVTPGVYGDDCLFGLDYTVGGLKGSPRTTYEAHVAIDGAAGGDSALVRDDITRADNGELQQTLDGGVTYPTSNDQVDVSMTLLRDGDAIAGSATVTVDLEQSVCAT